MKFLLTNDDGIDAPGLAALEEAVREHGECVTIAPRTPFSGCGHQATTHSALRVAEIAPARFAVAGTPVDCVRIGLMHLVSDANWVISGVNDGANLGVDVYMSGTVAAAREGCWMGRRSMAISQYREPRSSRPWSQTMEQTRHVLSMLLAAELPEKSYFNVNLPDGPRRHAEIANEDGTTDDSVTCDITTSPPPGPDDQTDSDRIVFCPLDPHPLPTRFRQHGDGYTYAGVYQQRQRARGSDVDICFSGRVAVTQILSSP